MNGFKTLSAVLRSVWLIDPGYVQAHLPLIHGIISGSSSGAEFFTGSGEFEMPFVVKDGVRTEAYFYNRKTGRMEFNEEFFQENSVAVIPVIGPVLKYDGSCGEPGMVQRSAWIKDLNGSAKVKGIIFQIDSPGGQADGTPQFANLIKSINKPKIAYVDGGAYSAGYWTASATDEIILSHEFSGVGSIGAYSTILDYRGYFEKQGYKVHEIYPDESADKNLGYRKALEGDYTLAKKDIADLANYFRQAVSSNRGTKLNNDSWNTGKTFKASDAITIGLADRVGSFDDAITAVLFGKPTIKGNKSSSNSKTDNMKFPKLTALADRKGDEVSAEELEQVNAELTEAGIVDHTVVPQSLINDAADATANLDIANSRITELEGQLSERDATISELQSTTSTNEQTIASLSAERDAAQARVTELESKLPGGSGKKAVSKGDKTEVTPTSGPSSWEQRANRKFA